MKYPYLVILVTWVIFFSCTGTKQHTDGQVWLDPSLPADIRAGELLEAMTLEEKISLLSETAPEIERLNIAAYNYGNEALHGLVRPGKATVFPQAIALGATFNPELIREMASAISDEAHAKYNASGGKMDEYRLKGRTYMFLKEKPLYPFGFGLSYTEFDYQDLTVEKTGQNEAAELKVNFNLSNIGNYNGDEVTQVYIRHLEPQTVQPIKQLKGFKRVSLSKGKTKQVQVEILVNELKYWDTKSGKFILEPGEYEIMVGASSEDIRLRKQINL
jgi:hypothetical protein